jgi:hypothetical protein
MMIHVPGEAPPQFNGLTDSPSTPIVSVSGNPKNAAAARS